MNRNNIRSPSDALDYLTDCTLATVISLAALKSRSNYELRRQISIAQTGLSLMKQFGVSPEGSRAEDVIKDFQGSVQQWSDSFDVKLKEKKEKQ